MKNLFLFICVIAFSCNKSKESKPLIEGKVIEYHTVTRNPFTVNIYFQGTPVINYDIYDCYGDLQWDYSFDSAGITVNKLNQPVFDKTSNNSCLPLDGGAKKMTINQKIFIRPNDSVNIKINYKFVLHDTKIVLKEGTISL